MKLPDPITVGYRTYDIGYLSPTSAAEYYGVCSREQSVIAVRKDMSPIETAATLIHELLHACWNNIPGGEELEEQAVSVLSDTLTQVWRDNPHLIKWLSRNIR